MAASMALVGLLSVVLGKVSLATRVDAGKAALLGLAAGVALWGATRAFVEVVSRWPPFARHVEEIYDQRKGLSLGAALVLATIVVAPGEEAFWRGLVQSRIAEEGSRLAGAAVAWAGYVAANAA